MREYLKFRSGLSKKYRTCTKQKDYSKFKSQLLRQIKSEKNEFHGIIKYYIYLSDLKMKNYRGLDENLKKEDLIMTNYYKVHNIRNINYYIFAALLLSFLQFFIVTYNYNNNEVVLFSLFYIPLLLSIVFIEYSIVNILVAFRQTYKEILNDEIIIEDKEYKYSYLIEMYSSWSYREARMSTIRFLMDNKYIRFLLVMLVCVSLVIKYSDYPILVINLALIQIIIFYSIYRTVIGNIPSFIIGKIKIKNIGFNPFSLDQVSGTKNLYKIFAYKLIRALIEMFICYMLLYVFDFIEGNSELGRLDFKKVSDNHYMYYAIMLWCFYRIVKTVILTIQLTKRLNDQKKKCFNSILIKLRDNTADEKDKITLTIVEKFQVVTWANFKKIHKFVFWWCTIIINFTLAIFPEFYKNNFTYLWNIIFK